MEKSSKAFRNISEVEALIGVPRHTLRYWETKIDELRPLKRGGNRRLYSPREINFLSGLRKLLQDDGMTIAGVRKILDRDGIATIESLQPVTLPDSPDARGNGEPATGRMRESASPAAKAPGDATDGDLDPERRGAERGGGGPAEIPPAREVAGAFADPGGNGPARAADSPLTASERERLLAAHARLVELRRRIGEELSEKPREGD